ncbi:uracil-DNA glycosylase family protein [Paenibacillaceae bacterium WGS1546]|uniref:uracil-DNA glycosylase family protein n=1 Tax=Cohnella sp. WGS1546 TaxID=3366810 RepID=UPI00372CF1FF
MVNIKNELKSISDGAENLRFNDLDVDPQAIRAIMINEIVPSDPEQDFYGGGSAQYLETVIPLFQKAGLPVTSIEDILKMGIYLTNAVKKPKSQYTVEKSSIERSLPFLERELSLFPHVRVIMLMGDIAKKAFNLLAKKKTGKNAVPSIPTYKIRHSEIYYGDIRVMPSYIMTGGNILIEKSKFEMAAEDIALMAKLISERS